MDWTRPFSDAQPPTPTTTAATTTTTATTHAHTRTHLPSHVDKRSDHAQIIISTLDVLPHLAISQSDLDPFHYAHPTSHQAYNRGD